MKHIVMLVLLPAIYAVWAVCAVQIWEWHVMPMFGLPALSFWAAIGISDTLIVLRMNKGRGTLGANDGY